jgi:hypothetical protein
MRNPISVHWKTFNVDEVQPEIECSKNAFADYLQKAPRKSTKSKHGLMGPVGKILSELKNGRREPGYLKGYIVRIHRNQSERGGPSPAAMEQLERGIDTIAKLLSGAPITVHDEILDRLDYGLYYELLRRQAESRAAVSEKWREFVRARYGTDEHLASAWDEPSVTIDDLYIPKKTEGSRSRKANNRQRDVADFWESQGATLAAEEEDE